MHVNFIVQQNEAVALTRGGRPTRLFDVVDLILKNGGSVRGKDLKPLVPQPPALYSLLKSEPGILRDTTGAFPTLSVSDDLYQRYVAACKEMNRPYYDQKGTQQGAPAGTPVAPEPAPGTPSGPVQHVVFFSDDADKNGATPNYFAMIADEICITEYLSAD